MSAETTVAPQPGSGWFVVVERSTLGTAEPLPPYVVGPYATEVEAQEEVESDSGIAFCLLTIDAKEERYNADDCYATDVPPRWCSWIIPA
ncbi:hypothetical protein GCM10011584_34410 [Nocardioides phosphati]|uniref:Uncharacterized protein n=1 Tax=Nocardioides phosphati TaxID=1867775 RepID=A0ABQ2NDT0_9ACTN|nr:hypothetical protein [Nocardioides phosphati]GGO94115.1 hypothetical protein GCM10011584_34410 [Nocardioides phosphati]